MPVVRVLIVTEDWPSVVDGGFLRWVDQPSVEAQGPRNRQFHLGEFLRVLRATTWVGMTPTFTTAIRPSGVPGETPAMTSARTGADVTDFRFDRSFVVDGAKRVIADFDVILYFAMEPGFALPALQHEADAIAGFMAGGGGFFATGDHEDLGGTLCGLVPRVRSMRRWYYDGVGHLSASGSGPSGEPGAPSALGPDRHDTTQPSAAGITIFENQSDDIAQRIAPAHFPIGEQDGAGWRITEHVPHPLLCSPAGEVDALPDHMHEGRCEVPTGLAARRFTLDGATVREYPDGPAGSPLPPVIVATGEVRPGRLSPIGLERDGEHTGGTIPADADRFGVICAYDGQEVGIGRVVVDSTFHHFFDINLTGDRFLEGLVPATSPYLHGFFSPDGSGGFAPTADYRKIESYYRNLVYWLAPGHLQTRIAWATLLPSVRNSGLVEQLYRQSLDHFLDDVDLYALHYYGTVAATYFRRARGHCLEVTITATLFIERRPWWWVLLPRPVGPGDPVGPPVDELDSVRDGFASAIGFAPDRRALATIMLGAVLAAVVAAEGDVGDGYSVEEVAARLSGKTVGRALDRYVELGRERIAETGAFLASLSQRQPTEGR